jgi:ubiquinone/menaquinone biosynthesis C-methylase UbiE
MKLQNPEKRLEKFWGKVDKKHIHIIQQFLIGKNVLDLGCGYGTTTAGITSSGYNCIGVDNDSAAIKVAKEKFPNCIFNVADAEILPFKDRYFDVVVLRDAIHHLFNEGDFNKIKSEILRVSKGNSRIILFDPNITFILKVMRRVSFHQDEEFPAEKALELMHHLEYKIIHYSYNTLYSLPLSGGYVGVNFLPNIKFIHTAVLSTEKILEKAINYFRLGRYFCFRYIVVGERTSG